MIDLNALKIYVDFRPDFKEDKNHFRNYTKQIREDGIIEFIEDGRLDTLQIITDDFRVDIHNFDDPTNESSWDFALPPLKHYFTSVNDDIMKMLCGNSCFCFDLGVYQEEPQQSTQDDMFIERYTKWIYFQFDYKFMTLFSIGEFCKLLNDKYDTHQVNDRGWAEVKMFTETISFESISKIFQKLLKLIYIEKEISDAMYKTRNQYYDSHKDQWFKTLEK